MGQGSVDYLGEDFTTTLTLGNIDILNKTGKSDVMSQTSLCQYLIMKHIYVFYIGHSSCRFYVSLQFTV